MRSLLRPAAEPSRHPVDVGQRSEAIILAELVKRGYRILLPYGTNHRYDLVIDVGSRFLRAQCKTGRLLDGVISFPTQSTRANTRGCFHAPYDAGQIDLFLVYCPGTDRVYAVGIGEVGSGKGFLRVAPTMNGQAKRIRWAADHELPA
jgi:PD-(D/E)XK nuclease superfamily protein